MHFFKMKHILRKTILLFFRYIDMGRAHPLRACAERALNETFHGFDSFEGLPDAWAGTSFVKGAFSLQGKLPRVPKNVILHKGWFNEVLPLNI